MSEKGTSWARVVVMGLGVLALLGAAAPVSLALPTGTGSRAGVPGRVWVRHYQGPTEVWEDFATSIAVSPDGAFVYVGGESRAGNSFGDFGTVAYSALTGAQVWVARYNGLGNY